ncbi:hypothetical protein K493DRAFT_333401 [Basidiobolus meristosporus CBS 931.73]|uniref:Uncharacterized protein n=1 Tax=Basidiobolus meristosporus CBS 931.73 TaxID=1314790 RepID=A0A1Y1Z672_9FUNG|nr:hypothetical protein K493DRAFT_333401 [Basidiobolus meristosporus CBS 931.73]|eukprot:ORY05751.1 hypothetical protein K493DRAFT_333401 [Basidiobolus meristosporus CBS 931.73]
MLIIPIDCANHHAEHQGKEPEMRHFDPCVESFALLRSAGYVIHSLQEFSSSYEQEMKSVFSRWKVPQSVINAVTLCQADWELYQKSYLKANILYDIYLHQFHLDWQSKQGERSRALIQNFLIPFRILYCRGLIYRALGDFRQARLNLLPILCSLPFNNINELYVGHENHDIVPFRAASATELFASAYIQILNAYEMDMRENGVKETLLWNFVSLSQYTALERDHRIAFFCENIVCVKKVHHDLFDQIFDENIIQSLYSFLAKTGINVSAAEPPLNLDQFKAKFKYSKPPPDDYKSLLVNTARRAYTQERNQVL